MTSPASSSTAAPFVLVHGAWHGGWCWREVARRLAAAGREVFTPSLTGLGDRRHLFAAGLSIDDHVRDVVELIEVERLDGCVLVGHSYGGNVITGVADRLRDRVSHYVYLDAVVPPDGTTLWRWSDFNDEAERRAREAAICGSGAGVCLPAPPAEVFGLPAGPLRDSVSARLSPMPAGTYRLPIAFERGGSVGLRRSYIAAVDPVYVPMTRVHSRLKGAPGWRYVELAGGHDVMVTRPEALTELLLSLAG